MQEDKKQSGLSWSTPATPAVPAPAKASASTKAPLPVAAPTKKAVQSQAPIYAGLLVGGIIVGVLLTTTWSSYNSYKQDRSVAGVATTTRAEAAQVEGAPSTSSTPSIAGSTVGAPLVVNDQPAGTEVTISKLNISKPTWVVVYVSRSGKPGNALGARLFFSGDTRGQVALLRSTEAGQTYFVGLSVDNGDRIFSLSKDKPLADADGGPLWATFSAR